MPEHSESSKVSWPRNVVAIISALLLVASTIAMIVDPRVIQKLKSELRAEQEKVDEQRVSNRVLSGGIEARIDAMMDALEKNGR